MRLYRNQCKLEGVRYKVHPVSNDLTAIQLLFSQGYCSRLLKAEWENEENMIEVRAGTGQEIGAYEMKQIRMTHKMLQVQRKTGMNEDANVQVTHSFYSTNGKLLVALKTSYMHKDPEDHTNRLKDLNLNPIGITLRTEGDRESFTVGLATLPFSDVLNTALVRHVGMDDAETQEVADSLSFNQGIA